MRFYICVYLLTCLYAFNLLSSDEPPHKVQKTQERQDQIRSPFTRISQKDIQNNIDGIWQFASPEKQSALAVYASAKAADVLHTLLDREYISPDFTDSNGKPLIAYACENQNDDAVKALIEHGATCKNMPHTYTSYRMTDGTPLTKQATYEKNYKALFNAIRKGAICIDHDENTLLHWATEQSDSIITAFCLHYRPDLIHRKNNQHITPFDMLSSLNTNVCTYDGEDEDEDEEQAATLIEWLEYAINTNNTDMFDTIVSKTHPRYLTATTHSGLTLLAIAATNGTESIIETLRDYIQQHDKSLWQEMLSEEILASPHNAHPREALSVSDSIKETALHRVSRTCTPIAYSASLYILGTDHDATLLEIPDEYYDTPLENTVLNEKGGMLGILLCASREHPEIKDIIATAFCEKSNSCTRDAILFSSTRNLSHVLQEYIPQDITQEHTSSQKLAYAIACIDESKPVPKACYTHTTVLPLLSYAIRSEDTHNVLLLSQQLAGYTKQLKILSGMAPHIRNPHVKTTIENVLETTHCPLNKTKTSIPHKIMHRKITPYNKSRK